MGHVVNPISFRLGKVLFWKTNFLHYKQKFLFNKLFYISMFVFKLFYWLFQVKLTLNFFFNRVKRFRKKQFFIKKHNKVNFLSNKTFFFDFLVRIQNFFKFGLIYDVYVYQRKKEIISFSADVLYNNECIEIFYKNGFYFYKYVSILLYFLRLKYKKMSLKKLLKLCKFILKIPKKRKLFLELKFKKLRYFRILKFYYAKLINKFCNFNNYLVYYVLYVKSFFFFKNRIRLKKKNTLLLKDSLKRIFYYFLKRLNIIFFLKKIRKKIRNFRKIFKSMVLNMEVQDVGVFFNSKYLKINLIIFKEMLIDKFKKNVFNFFFLQSTVFYLKIIKYYFVLTSRLKQKLILLWIMLQLTIYFNFFNLSKLFRIIFLKMKIFDVRNLNIFNIFNCYFLRITQKVPLFNFHKLIISKFNKKILQNLVKNLVKNYTILISYFFINNNMLNAQIIFKFISRQLFLNKPINRIIKIVLLELSRFKKFAGFKILMRGRFTRKERAFNKVWTVGKIPTSAVVKPLDYLSNIFISKFGVGSIRIWLYR
jgi:hypothetical protein